MARCSIWPPARKAMATPSRSGSGAANGPSTRKRKDRTTRKETPMTDTSRLSRSEEHTSELQSLMRISYAVFCLKKKKKKTEKSNVVAQVQARDTQKHHTTRTT